MVSIKNILEGLLLCVTNGLFCCCVKIESEPRQSSLDSPISPVNSLL